MFRIAGVLAIASVLLLAGWPSTTNAECCGRRIGDVNCDALIDSRDARDVLKFHVGFLKQLDCFGNSNVDGVWEVTSIDSMLILKFHAGLIDHLPPVKTYTGTIVRYEGIESNCLALDTGDGFYGVWDLGAAVVGDRVEVLGFLNDKMFFLCGVPSVIDNSSIHILP